MPLIYGSWLLGLFKGLVVLLLVTAQTIIKKVILLNEEWNLSYIATLLTLSFVRSPKYGEKLTANQVDWNYSFGSLYWFLQFVLEHGQQDDYWFNNKLIVLLSSVSLFGLILFIWRQS
jgi:hypothetical protein